MSPGLNGSSVIWHFEGSDVIEICNGITFEFYTGLPHIVPCFSAPLEKTWVVQAVQPTNAEVKRSQCSANIFLGKCVSITLMDIIKRKKTTPSNVAEAGFEIIQ